jgi:hypothetical protein
MRNFSLTKGGTDSLEFEICERGYNNEYVICFVENSVVVNILFVNPCSKEVDFVIIESLLVVFEELISFNPFSSSLPALVRRKQPIRNCIFWPFQGPDCNGQRSDARCLYRLHQRSHSLQSRY